MPQNPTRQVHALLGALMKHKTRNHKERLSLTEFKFTYNGEQKKQLKSSGLRVALFRLLSAGNQLVCCYGSATHPDNHSSVLVGNDPANNQNNPKQPYYSSENWENLIRHGILLFIHGNKLFQKLCPIVVSIGLFAIMYIIFLNIN
jgi:hypothetical protein